MVYVAAPISLFRAVHQRLPFEGTGRAVALRFQSPFPA